MENDAHALSAIRRHVWAGWYDVGEIAIIIGEEFFEPGQADNDWLQARIEEESRQKRAEEATWPAITDCDRLDRVFEGLEAQVIIALQDAGLTKSDGHEDVTEAYEDAGGRESNIVGYCFYHGQDLERVMASAELWLAFGDIDGRGCDASARTA